MGERTTRAILLIPTGNNIGDFYLYSVFTGNYLNSQQWTEISMPDEVIGWIKNVTAQIECVQYHQI